MVKVRVEQGWLEGEQLDLVTGDGQYYSFKGVPYAAPPLGKLRFKAPEPPSQWEGVRKATEHGPVCPSVDIFTNEYSPGASEDCLYLNIYTRNLTPTAPLPVMLFIHGGGYKSGSGNVDNYGPDFLVNQDVVLVTINYRLEALGFLCLDIPEVPGNAGMKDQVAALKWVRNNIKSFGGDPENVTVFGESAGGASTCLHVLSPMSKGLFKRAIPMSGAPNCDFSIAFEPKKRAFNVGKLLGLETNDPYELLEFLQNVPVEKLVNTNPCVLSMEETMNNILKFYHFTPVVEKDFGGEHFLTEDPVEAVKKGHVNKSDVLIGFTDQEIIIGISVLENLLNVYNRYPELLVPKRILYNVAPNKIPELSDIIRKRYFGDGPLTVKESLPYFNETSLTFDIHSFTNFLQETGKCKVYQYRFSCFSKRNIYGMLGANYDVTGASHLDDLCYLFDPKKANLEISKDTREYKLVKLTCTLFTNFAKYGNPTPDSSLGVTWPEYGARDGNFVDIGDTPTPGTRDNDEALAFWRGLYKQAGLNYP